MAALLAPSPPRDRVTMPFSLAASYEPPFPLTPEASARVGSALAAAVRTHDAAMRELHAAVEACVAELHVLGMPPEVALRTMKEVVRHAATRRPPPGYAPSLHAADGLMDEVVHWTIAAFFRREVPPDGPPPRPGPAAASG